MHSFEISEAVWCAVNSITNRTESHGDDSNVPAVSFGLAIACDRSFIAAHLGADVADSLFKELVSEQMPLEAVEPTWVLRAPSISIVSLDKKLEGWTVRIAHGIEDATSSELVFGGCKLDAFRVEPGLRESTIMFRVGTSDVDAVRLGELGMLLKQEIELTITAPVVKHTIDASSGSDAPRTQVQSDAEDLFGAGDEGGGDNEAEHDYQPIDALIDSTSDLSADQVENGEIVDNDPLGIEAGQASKDALDAGVNPFATPSEAEPKPARRGRKRSTVAAE